MRWQELSRQLWQGHRALVILSILLLLINVLLWGFLKQSIEPRVISHENNLLSRQTEVRHLLRNQVDAANSPEQKFYMATQDLAKFYGTIPEYNEFTGLIEEILVLSNRARLVITQVNYTSEEVKKRNLIRIGLNFNVSGDYDQLKQFIHSLEQAARLIVINQISLQESNEQGVNLRLSLETYFRPEGREI